MNPSSPNSPHLVEQKNAVNILVITTKKCVYLSHVCRAVSAYSDHEKKNISVAEKKFDFCLEVQFPP